MLFPRSDKSRLFLRVANVMHVDSLYSCEDIICDQRFCISGSSVMIKSSVSRLVVLILEQQCNITGIKDHAKTTSRFKPSIAQIKLRSYYLACFPHICHFSIAYEWSGSLITLPTVEHFFNRCWRNNCWVYSNKCDTLREIKIRTVKKASSCQSFGLSVN